MFGKCKRQILSERIRDFFFQKLTCMTFKLTGLQLKVTMSLFSTTSNLIMESPVPIAYRYYTPTSS